MATQFLSGWILYSQNLLAFEEGLKRQQLMSQPVLRQWHASDGQRMGEGKYRSQQLMKTLSVVR